MQVISTEKYNTNNAWGFGGGIGVKTTFDNGVTHKKGKAYFRHLPPESYQRWDVGDLDPEYPEFTIRVDGKKSDKIYVYRSNGGCGDDYRAYFTEQKDLALWGREWSLVKTIDLAWSFRRFCQTKQTIFMDIVHIKITFEDTFSFAKTVKYCTRSAETFERMKNDIGKIVIDRFDKASQIHETLRLVSVERGWPSRFCQTKNYNLMDQLDQMIAFEQGELDSDGVLELFSNLIKSGLVWSLQGFYGRTAHALIQAGRITQDGLILEQ
jgi:hypothetical protein